MINLFLSFIKKKMIYRKKRVQTAIDVKQMLSFLKLIQLQQEIRRTLSFLFITTTCLFPCLNTMRKTLIISSVCFSRKGQSTATTLMLYLNGGSAVRRRATFTLCSTKILKQILKSSFFLRIYFSCNLLYSFGTISVSL